MSDDKMELKSRNHLSEFLEKPENYLKVRVTFNMKQEDLTQLATSDIGSKLKELSFTPKYGSRSAVIDFSQVQFPALEKLEIHHQVIEAIDFTQENYPELQSLTIEQITAKNPSYFKTDLPKLRFMSFQFITIDDPLGFGDSLSSSPNLEYFSGYKLWGLGTSKKHTHRLVLPKCEELDLYRSDDLTYLKIWAPKLQSLNLQACYSLEEVTILDRKPNGYSGEEYGFNGDPSKYTLNLVNAPKPKGNVTTHQRCKKILEEFEELGFF